MVMNALLHELIEHEWIDREYVDQHTVGFDELAKMVATCTPERAAEICDVSADELREAARVIGAADGWSPRSFKASTNPTRPPPRPSRSTTSTSSAG
jgi:anaerobic selenocysteine-containing dehydrogenase